MLEVASLRFERMWESMSIFKNSKMDCGEDLFLKKLNIQCIVAQFSNLIINSQAILI